MSAGPRVPPRPLLVLSVPVLLLHALALQGAPATLAWRERHDAASSTPAMLAPPARLQWVIAPAPAAQQVPRVVAGSASDRGMKALQAVSPHAARVEADEPPSASDSDSASAFASDFDSTSALVSESASALAAAYAPAAQGSTAPAPAVLVPGPARWHYALTALHRGLPIAGRAELDWWHDGQRYEASLRLDVPPLASRLQHSAGTLQPHGLAPQRYSERQRGEQAAHFDREAGRIMFSARTGSAALHAGAQDRLSVLLQLAALLAASPRGWSAGDTLALQTATTREAHEWRFRVDGVEALALAAGSVDAFKLTRAPRHEWEPRLELWLVPGADYGPVRLRLTPANGDWLDMQWSGTDKR